MKKRQLGGPGLESFCNWPRVHGTEPRLRPGH